MVILYSNYTISIILFRSKYQISKFFAQASLILKTKKYDSSYPLDAFSSFMIIAGWIVFLPSFAMISAASLWSLVAWLLAAVLAVLWTGFLLLLVLLSPVAAIALVVLSLGRYDSGSSNRESDENRYNSTYESHWLPRFEEERQQKEKEREELMSSKDEDS